MAVIGLGLMGGSLARALRALPRRPEVVGFSPLREERDAALSAGALQRASERSEDAAASADLVVYATPLAATLGLLGRHRDVWRPDAVISDVSGLKVPVAARARALGVEARYVGAHPMVGSEASGFGASRPGLYRDAVVWLAGDAAPEEVRVRVERFWAALGARPAWTVPETHDLRMVRASHLPQVLANALALCLEAGGLSPDDLGPGGRDMTRLAGSSPEMWRDLLEHSAPFLAPVLRELGVSLGGLAATLEAGDLDAMTRLMERTREWSGAEGRPATPEDADGAALLEPLHAPEAGG